MSAILVACCGDCAAWWSLPRGRCPRCGSDRVRRREASGRATLWAASRVHRTPDPAFAPRVPFLVGLVTLEEGPRLMAHLSTDAPIGTRLAGAVEEVAGRPVPVFSPEEP